MPCHNRIKVNNMEKRLEITDKLESPKGFVEFARFSINEDGELHSLITKKIPKDIIINAIKQWIENEEK